MYSIAELLRSQTPPHVHSNLSSSSHDQPLTSRCGATLAPSARITIADDTARAITGDRTPHSPELRWCARSSAPSSADPPVGANTPPHANMQPDADTQPDARTKRRGRR